MLQLWPLCVTHAKEAYTTLNKIKDILIDDSKELIATCERSEALNNRIRNTADDDVKKVLIESIKGTMLKCDNLEFVNGKTYALLGYSSSLSSAFLQLVLGENEAPQMDKIEIYGKMSFVSCDSWIFSGSIRENIIFTEKYHRNRYENILKLCSLDDDINSLSTGDETLIDEFCLSENFKRKINLARGLYRHADIYIFEECGREVREHFNPIVKEFLKVKNDKMILFCCMNCSYL
jgi:ABC-type transport system involved in cytochrome bd biosynthesis fused ATPase/permease subunit